MRRTFLLNLALVLVLNLLVKPFYIFGIDAEVQVRAGTQAYGSYAALMSLSFMLNILLDLGITNWNTRHIAHNAGEMREHVSGILPLRAVLSILYAAVMMVAALVLGYRGGSMTLLGLLVVNQVLVATVLYLRSNLAGAQRFAQDSLVSVLDRLLLIGICAWLLWGRTTGGAFPIVWFVYAQMLAYGITALVAFVLVARLGGTPWPRFNTAFARSVLRDSSPYALLVLLMSFYYRTDTVMLERLLPDGALHAGIYAQAFRFFEAFNMIGFLFAGLLLPMFSRMLARGEDVGPLTGLSVRLLLAGSLGVAVVATFFARPIMDLRYHEHTEVSAPAFAVLMWSFVAVCITYVFGTLLTASGDLRTLNRMAACGVVLNLGLNWVLIPRYQAMGAAYTGLITQGSMAVVQVVISMRRFHLRPGFLVVLRGACYPVVIVALAAWCAAHGDTLPQALMVLVPTAVVAAFASGLLPLEGLRQLLSRRASF